MALSVSGIMTLVIVALAPLCLAIFTYHQPEHRLKIREIWSTFWQGHYWIHALTYILMVRFKGITDTFNEPLKGQTGDFTHLVHAIEGNFALYVQKIFENGVLTDFLNFHYLFIYLFIIAFTPAYYIFSKDQGMADKAVMNYVLIYVLAVPYYLFFNVEVTSSYLPGMRALLYHDSARFYEFFTTHDPLDNAFPSLHTAIPWGLLFLHYIHVKEKGIKMREWRHRPYHLFVLVNTLIFMFSILYLGIHWVTDIFTGMALAFLGALFVHAFQPKLRAFRARDVTKRDPRTIIGNLSLQSFMAVLLVGMLALTIQYQVDDSPSRPNLRLGPQDINLDVFEPVPDGETIHIQVTNFHAEQEVQAILAPRDATQDAVADGGFNWTLLTANRTVLTFSPNTTTDLAIKQPDTWFVLLLYNPAEPSNTTDEFEFFEDPATVRIRAIYPDDVVLEATLLSIPSFLITTYVLHRQLRLWVARRPWYSSGRGTDWV